MYLQTTFTLALTLDADKFEKIFSRACNSAEYSDEDEYVDKSMLNKGITVFYRDSQYKKKIKLAVNPAWLLDSNEANPDKLIRKLEKRIDDYFNSKYQLNDFKLTGMHISTDIDVRDREKVAAYMKVLQRVGKVKGFSPPSEHRIDDDISFCLDGNSNGIEFAAYDLERLMKEQTGDTDYDRKQLKAITKKAEGLIRANVRLTKPKAIRAYTDEPGTAGQIADLSDKSKNIFLDTFMRVVPFGNFHKKDEAVEIIRREVTDNILKRKMLRLLELIPEKKSLLLAQKALNYRDIDFVMATFGTIKLSPVTISKRHDVRKLDNLYKYM
ncbi:hypothetical protein FACS1894219_08290 [Clostridia bacterium]|nr:hypothetical protein FACS1894219_08290 [Clostridia bacterium]